MNGNEGYWGGGISIISQNFPKSPSILFYPFESSIFQTSLSGDCSRPTPRQPWYCRGRRNSSARNSASRLPRWWCGRVVGSGAWCGEATADEPVRGVHRPRGVHSRKIPALAPRRPATRRATTVNTRRRGIRACAPAPCSSMFGWACSVGWCLIVGAGLFWEKSTVDWLLMADLFWEKSTTRWWLRSQTNMLEVSVGRSGRHGGDRSRASRKAETLAGPSPTGPAGYLAWAES
jgi:hypothetical protein